MGNTRFSEILGDDFALGGLARGMPLITMPPLRTHGHILHAKDSAAFTTGATGAWTVLPIALGVGTVTTNAVSQSLVFIGDTADTAGRGSDFIFGSVKTGGAGAAAPALVTPAFRLFDSGATRAFPTEAYVEFLIRKGLNSSSWANHSSAFGMASTTTTYPATTFMDTTGAIVETTNFAMFHFDDSATPDNTINCLVAGGAGGVQTVANLSLPAATYAGKFIAFGIRAIGLRRLEFYMNRRRVGLLTLSAANAFSGNAFTISLSAVLHSSTGSGDDVLQCQHIAFGGTRDPSLYPYLQGNPNG